MQQGEYISREELEKSGFRKVGAVIVRLDVLNRYAENGDLDLGSPNIDAMARVSAGSRLFVDFVKGDLVGCKAIDLAKIRVDGGGKRPEPAFVLSHRQAYVEALRCLPWQFRQSVRRVCIEDMPLVYAGEKSISRHRKLQYVDRAKYLLNLGLDCLVRHYLHKTKGEGARQILKKY